ncbi:hypothetical protein [Streptomyces hoynatensis]|uniref:Tetratricopeptide repeat protein n=1 Tax=Streptomyces hoynatensis TaxID=1141874 RepID=A0A3A9ZI68_9ACTN|nr:hypothetical protein [Streptomyces hoynatensis]RKN47037.1 hypothetical protein D7294_02310 [Streptomyces hoynatensis]
MSGTGADGTTGYGGGFGGVLPPSPPLPPGAPLPPDRPPTAGLPRDPITAATAALGNLTGLGAGYLFLRRWPRAALAWLVTAAFLFAVLPVTAEGVAGGWVAAYLLCLAALAADAWRLARPPAPRRPGVWVPAAAVVAVAALAAGSVVWCGDAQERALERDLRQELAAADAQVAAVRSDPFDQARDGYDSALATYLGVRAHHPSTDAAAEVPARIDALYEAATAPRGGQDGCAGLEPLRYLADLPEDWDDAEAERLAERAVAELPEPLHACGMQHLDTDPVAAAEPFTELLSEHGDSEYATGLAEELGARQGQAVGALEGDTACEALDEIRGLAGLFGRLPGADFSRLAEEGAAAEPDGLYECGVSRFLAGAFEDARSTLEELIQDHPEDGRVDRARDIVIAARIAAEVPAAGEELPPESGGGGATVRVEVYNDSPYELEVLYTGPRTGRDTVEPCGDCSVYPAGTGEDEFCPRGTDYPHTVLNLPAGEYQLLFGTADEEIRPNGASDSFDSAYIYTYCNYVTEDSLLPGTDV